MLAFCAAVPSMAETFSLDYAREPRSYSSISTASCETLDAGVIRRVEIPAGEAPVFKGNLAVGDSLDVRLFDGCEIVLSLQEATPTQCGGAAFLATADGYDGQFVAAVVLKDGLMQIDIQDYLAGRVYSVLASPERTIVKEMDPSCLPCGCGESPEVPSVQTEQASGSAGVSSCMTVSSQYSASFALVDILVVYDTLGAAWANSEGGGTETFAEVQVQKMNAVLANTNLDQHFRFRLVGVYEVGGSAGGSIPYALQAAQSGTLRLNGVLWDGVKAKRDEVEADIVCVLIDNGSSTGTTGQGYSLRQDSSGFSEYAYNACLIRAVAQSQTMTHEVGHNMGAGHATAVADETNRGPQYFSYSSGYYFTGTDKAGYHTVMAYNTDGYGNYYTSAPYFSSPNYTYKSVPVGDAYHDNSFTIQQTFPEVSGYRGGVLYLDELATATETESEGFAWKTSPAYPWSSAEDDAYDGIDAVRSCEMPYTSTSWMETAITGPADVSFMYKLRTYGGTFEVTCDGESLLKRSGEVSYGSSWESARVSVPSGNHSLRIAYTHPGQGFTTGGNGVWIDCVSISDGSPAPAEYEIDASGTLLKADLRGGSVAVIPDGVTSIAPYAFACDPRLESVTVPSSVTSIGEYAFAGCSGLARVDLPSTLQGTLDASVFYACPSGLDIAYYAVPYTIAFHRNDASNEKTASRDFEYGKSTRLPTLASLGWARRGFEFKGWATSAANAAKGKVWKGDWGVVSAAAAPGKTLDVYAVWALKPGYYAVTFIRNDGAGTWRTVGFPHGTKTRMPSLANGLGWARRGYAFKGWELTTANANDNTRENPWKGDWAYVSTPVAAGKTLTVYARWELKPGYYQIRFNKNDGTGKWRTLGFECGKSTKLSTIAGLGWERDGWSMLGWGSNKANAEAGKIWKTDGAWVKDVISEGKTLSIYAIWE